MTKSNVSSIAYKIKSDRNVVAFVIKYFKFVRRREKNINEVYNLALADVLSNKTRNKKNNIILLVYCLKSLQNRREVLFRGIFKRNK
jgi:hypothetical protein